MSGEEVGEGAGVVCTPRCGREKGGVRGGGKFGKF